METVLGRQESITHSQTGEDALRDILTLLRSRTGHDFTRYDRTTVMQRIERRMSATAAQTLPAYRDHLRDNTAEAPALLRAMVIRLTRFYRNRRSFEAFERDVVPLLFEGKAGGDQVRVWCAGCSTGEEAYSAAMLLLEYAANLSRPPGIQVFATDIDQDAVRWARNGRYPEAIEADVPPARMERFFAKVAGGYRVNSEVRECVRFADHDLLRDPPFTDLDAILCRNLLIYLNPDVREQVFESFHLALRPAGRLFLGMSESVEGSAHLFSPVDEKHRLFRVNPVIQ